MHYENDNFGSGEATGGLNPPTLLQGHSRDLYRSNEKYFGY